MHGVVHSSTDRVAHDLLIESWIGYETGMGLAYDDRMDARVLDSEDLLDHLARAHDDLESHPRMMEDRIDDASRTPVFEVAPLTLILLCPSVGADARREWVVAAWSCFGLWK